MFLKAGIIGLGLIGGSLAKALKNRYGIKEIVALNRNTDVLEKAFNEKIIDKYDTKVTSIFSDCDIIFICTPVNKIVEYAKMLKPFINKNCIITDVGSTKNNIFDEMEKIENITFIGGHPMTGAEKFRYDASKEHLFENAYYILTPSLNATDVQVESYIDLIKKIGALPLVMDSNSHDNAVASISHVPHILAAALVNNVKHLDGKECYMHSLAAGGFKDITRIASGSPEMWEGICFENKDYILDVLSSLKSSINEFEKILFENDNKKVFNYFLEAKNYRDSFKPSQNKMLNLFNISVDVLDKPGSIAIISVLFANNGINIKNISIENNREGSGGVLSISFETSNEMEKSITLLKSLNYEVFKCC